MIGEKTKLRTLEPQDLDFLFDLENDKDNWLVSQTRVPFSKALLNQYIQSAQDIFVSNQIRFVITTYNTNEQVGFIDLFEFDPINQRVGVGIIIEKKYRKKGYASDALALIITYCFDTLLVHNIFCNILTSNQHSISLFTNKNFKLIGTKKDWINTANGWEDENVYQLLS